MLTKLMIATAIFCLGISHFQEPIRELIRAIFLG